MNSVSDGSRSRTLSAKSLSSMFATNRNVMVRSLYAFSASYAMTGPSAEAANANIHDIANALSGVALPISVADTVAEIVILSSTAWTRGTTLSPSTKADGTLGRAKRHVQGCPVFSDVYLLTAEHCIDPCLQSRLSCQLYEQLYCLVRYPILGVVEVYPCAFDRHAFTTRRVIGKESTEMRVTKLYVVVRQGPPCRTLLPADAG